MSIVLNSFYIDNGLAKILINISKTQDILIGDYTSTVEILAGELFKRRRKFDK